MKHIICILFLLIATFSFSQAQEFSYNGYLKNLTSYSEELYSGMSNDIGLWENTFQTRLNLNGYYKNFTLSVQSRHLFSYRKNQKTAQQFMDAYSENNAIWDLDYKFVNETNYFLKSEIDRLYLDWYKGSFQVTLGRQRIVWGTALVWNISDFFNPFNILDFDYEEKPGTDAIRVQYYTGPTSQLDIAFAPSENSNESILAARWLINWHNYDFNLMAAWQEKQQRIALNWAGYILDAGFRGEVVYTNPDYSFISTNPYAQYDCTQMDCIITKEINNPFWSAVVSFDYTFANSFYLHTEYLYNERGTTQNALLRTFDILYTGELSPARHSIFQEFSYDITPLLKADYFIIYNPSDKSQISVPSLQYSLSDNWGLYALAFLSSGKTLSEYGDYPSQYFLRLKYSF